MNLFYKYSHLQRFEQQNEKDGRNVKDNKMRKEKWEMKNEKWRWEKEKEKKKRLPASNTTAESLSSIISFLKNSQTISCSKQT